MGLRLVETIAVPIAHEAAYLTCWRVEYAVGEAETYVLPLALATGAAATRLEAEAPEAVAARLRFQQGGRQREGLLEAGGLLRRTASDRCCGGTEYAVGTDCRLDGETTRRTRMKLQTLRDLYVEQLQDLYSAETQLVKALPKMEKAATHPALKQAFQSHLAETERQVQRLEQIFQGLGQKAGGHTCKAMEGLIAEGNEMARMRGDPAAIDAGLIAAAQRVEHYEIAGYGCVRTYANQLGEQQSAMLLQQTLDEEGKTDKLLTQIAEQVINLEAER